MIPNFDQNDKLGFYSLNGKKLYSKPLALIESTKTGSFPQWNFNDKEFSKYEWSIEPAEDLRTLYRRRAQQLRDRYDYIKLEFSGGGDSSTVLYSFINNNIHLDEVIFRYPQAAEKNVSADPYNTKAENTLSEWEYAARPILQKLAVEHPEIKITFHDYTDRLIKNPAKDESWILNTREYFQPGWIYKHDFRAVADHMRVLDSGKTFCTIYGIDKPKLCVKDGGWYLYFMDIQANTANPDVGEFGGQIFNEYFYWTPDLPEILCKQSHIIRNWFMQPQNKHLQFLLRWPNHNWSQRTTYEQIIKPLIYPDYDPTTFQVSKPTNNFYNEMDHWFYVNCQETEFFKTWQAGLSYLVHNIDPKFLNFEMAKPVGLIGFVSPFYFLGSTDFVDNGKNIWHKWKDQ